MDITYLGHASFYINCNGTNILFDPFDIDTNIVNPEYIIISHAHQDHIGNSVEIALKYNSTVVSNYEIANWFAKKGIKSTHGMNLGGSFSFPFGKLKSVIAIHSSVFVDGTHGGNPCGYVIETDQDAFYYAGDTGLTLDMKLIGDYYKLNFAILPLGNNYTMGIDDAIVAAEFINCNKIIGMHYNTFPVIEIDKKNAIDKFKNKGKELILPEKGKTIKI